MHTFLENLLFYLPGEPSVLSLLQSYRCPFAASRSPVESFLLKRAVLARLRTQMSCELTLTRREGKGNDFFRPEGGAITGRCAHVWMADTLHLDVTL